MNHVTSMQSNSGTTETAPTSIFRPFIGTLSPSTRAAGTGFFGRSCFQSLEGLVSRESWRIGKGPKGPTCCYSFAMFFLRRHWLVVSSCCTVPSGFQRPQGGIGCRSLSASGFGCCDFRLCLRPTDQNL